MVTFARKIAIGVVLFILGAAAAIFTDEVMHSDGIVLLATFAFVAAGLAFTIPAGMDHAAFAKAHPYVADFYTAEEKATARRRASIAIVAGIAVILLGVAVAGLFEVESNVQVYGDSLMMVLVALGVGIIVHWGMLWGRTDLADYNKEWLETVELSDDELARLDQQSREAYLRANNPRRRGTADRKGKACMVIMLVATMVALVWLFAASAMGASEGVSGLFWLPWVRWMAWGAESPWSSSMTTMMPRPRTDVDFNRKPRFRNLDFAPAPYLRRAPRHRACGCRGRVRLAQQPPCGKADHAADDRCGEEGQQVIRQSVLRRPCAAGECPRVALDVGLTLHEREDLAVGH